MTVIDADTAVVERAFAGHLAEFRAIRQWDPERFRSAASGSDLVIEPRHVIRVLDDLLAGRADVPLVRQWADAVFWDVVSLDGGAIDVSITYEPQHEDVVAEAVARLQELGDVVDGELRPGEGEELLASLRATR